MSVYPTTINQTTPDEVQISWSDGHQGRVTLKRLRDSCPCAGCAGETVLLRTYTPPPVDETTPGRYVLKGAEPVGSYALKLTWGDGHDNGIYHWEYLRSLCECDECAARG
jgi:DUF971 family protein